MIGIKQYLWYNNIQFVGTLEKKEKEMTETTPGYASVYAEYLETSKPFYRRRHWYGMWKHQSFYLVMLWLLVAMVMGPLMPLLLFVVVPIAVIALPSFLYSRNEMRAMVELDKLSKRVVETAVGPRIRLQQLNWHECYFNLQGFTIHGSVFALAVSGGAVGFHVHGTTAVGSFREVVNEVANQAHWLKVHYGE